MRTNIGRSAALAVLTCALWSAPPAHSENAPIVIGLAVAQTGFMVAADGDAANSVKLWVEERNAKGGLLGRPLKEIMVDTKSDPAESARAGQAVVNQGADLVVVTCDYDQGSPAAAIAQRAGKISMFLCAGDPKAGIQGVGRYSFSAGIASQVEGAAIAEWAHKNLGVKKVYSLIDTGLEYSKSTCAGWDWAVKKNAIESLGSDTFRNDDPSILIADHTHRQFARETRRDNALHLPSRWRKRHPSDTGSRTEPASALWVRYGRNFLDQCCPQFVGFLHCRLCLSLGRRSECRTQHFSWQVRSQVRTPAGERVCNSALCVPGFVGQGRREGGYSRRCQSRANHGAV